jgi:hypothetical protein
MMRGLSCMLLFVAGCTQDFGVYEPNGNTPIDASSTEAGSDAAKLDASKPNDAAPDTGTCAVVDPCASNAKNCADACGSKSASCKGQCNNNQNCIQQCQGQESNKCQQTCVGCAQGGGCDPTSQCKSIVGL